MMNLPTRCRLAFYAFMFSWFLPAVPLANAQQLESAVDIVRLAVSDGDVPGASVLVMQHGTVVAARSFGVSDRGENRPFENDTICWIASLTKPVSAAAAMTLVDEGKLDLDVPIDHYLPEFEWHTAGDDKPPKITARQLMSHSSGIQSSVPLRPRFFFDSLWLARSLREIVPEIGKTSLVFEPGTSTAYSNAAPYVLGRIVEVQSGQSFEDYVRSKILQPLRMQDTGFSVSEEKQKRVAVVYRRDGDSIVEFCRYDPAWRVKMTMPDGGLFSTPGDIAKFASAFLGDESPILTTQSMQQMLRPQSDGYGLGWILDVPGQFSHWGSSGTLVWADRSAGVVGVLFTQTQDRKRVADLHDRFRSAVTRALSNR